MQFGVQLYTLRNYLKEQKDFPEVFERVKDMGAATVQVSGTGAFDSKFLGQLARDFELSVCATHSKFDRIKNELDVLAEEHSDFDCKQIGIGMLPSCYDKKSADDIRKFAQFLNETGEKLKKYDMNIAYHNHWFEFKKLDGDKTFFDILLEETEAFVQFIPDSYWIKVGGEDPASYLDRFFGRVSVLHLKDYKKKLFLPLMKPIGDGTLDFKNILAHAENIGVKSSVVELDISKKPFADLEKSLLYLNNM